MPAHARTYVRIRMYVCMYVSILLDYVYARDHVKRICVCVYIHIYIYNIHIHANSYLFLFMCRYTDTTTHICISV